MMKIEKLTINQRDLTKRYLIWCYKTTKEELDRTQRYFTQLDVDDFMLVELKKIKEYKSACDNDRYKGLVDDFEIYMQKKEKNVLKKKFFNVKEGILDSQYQYLEQRFAVIERAIIYFLGKTELTKIRTLYEHEMTQRIFQSREHS